MKVLHVLTTIDPAGAGPVEAARLYCSSSRGDYRAEVLTLDNDITAWRNSWPVPVHAIGHSRMYGRYSSALTSWLQEHASRFDAVVVHGVWGYHLIGVWKALRGGGVPYFLICHGMLNPWFRRTYPLKHLKKAAAWSLLVRRAVAGAASILYLCEEERRLALSNFRIDCPREAFAPLGTLVSSVGPGVFFEKHPLLRGKRIVLFLGRICYMKGCDILLDAFSGFASDNPGMQLVMCGPDHEGWQRDLVRKAAALGISDRVTWTGPLFGKSKWSALAAAELFALPSRCETFPVSVIEALACGTPVLITRDINIYPSVQSSSAGIVCDSNVESLRGALARWLAADQTERAAFRQRALECHSRHFSLDVALERHSAAIRSYLDGVAPGNVYSERLSA